MKMSCDNARGLVPSYLDGELSLEQAHPLREHLMDCRACREVAKDGKTLTRWFVDADPAGLVPEGFAARIARRAFAGDLGLDEPSVPAAHAAAPAARGSLLPFLLKSVTVAAAVLLVLAAGIQRLGLPPSEDLRAQPAPPWERPGAGPAPDLEAELAPASPDELGDAPSDPAHDVERTSSEDVDPGARR
jgi:hypothetical protein